MRRFLLIGPDAAVQSAMDRFLVRSTVLAIEERAGAAEVLNQEGLEPVLPLAGVTVLEMPCDEHAPYATGLEDDVAVRVSETILVRPPWVPRPEGFAGIELVVPRGMAFGSGEHGSTQAALLALDAAWTGGERSFADVGTGSGILALFARARGAGRILACDVDPAAVRAARELLPDAHVVLGGPEAFAERADCVAANLTGRELLDALPHILRLWNRSAALVLSGIREGEYGRVLAAIAEPPAAAHRAGGFIAVRFHGRRS
jgi:SAM-dependent methyltransferase